MYILLCNVLLFINDIICRSKKMTKHNIDTHRFKIISYSRFLIINHFSVSRMSGFSHENVCAWITLMKSNIDIIKRMTFKSDLWCCVVYFPCSISNLICVAIHSYVVCVMYLFNQLHVLVLIVCLLPRNTFALLITSETQYTIDVLNLKK